MTKGTKDRICLIAVMGMVAIGFISIGFIGVRSARNTCNMDVPQRVVSGWMDSLMFSSDSYYLFYEGTRKLSQDECLVSVQVTRREYERHMYKE